MPIQDDLQAFLAEWHDPSPFLEVQTSGSTGTPKRVRVRKDRMLNSARLTCDYLGLKKGDKALLCMPLRYIAGKMMVVRSLYAGLDLEVREPSGHPLADWGDTPLRFAAMIPLQVYNTLRVPEERKRLEQTDILIIGGGAIDAALEQEIRQMPNTVYSTYGNDGDAVSRRPAPVERAGSLALLPSLPLGDVILVTGQYLGDRRPIGLRRAAGDERCRPPAARREFRHYRKER